MNVQQIKQRIREHWEEWLPQKVADLKADQSYEAIVLWTAQQAHQRIKTLMASGYPDFAAEEVALKEFVLLDPEDGAGPSAEMAEELAEKEAYYQKHIAPYL
jgi:hypothetical protein